MKPQAYVFDLDGVVYRGGHPIEGAVEKINSLISEGEKVIFLTNNSTLTRGQFAEKLKKVGVMTDAGMVINSTYASALHLTEVFGRPCCVYAVGECGLAQEFEKYGFEVIRHDARTGRADAVVVGLDREFTYEKLRCAHSHIAAGARFFATNADSTMPVEHGFVPGCGSIVASIRTASGIEPEVVGKPHDPMMRILIKEYNLQPEKCILVGDRLDTDIVAGNKFGFYTVLVLTGVSSREDVETGDIKPKRIIESLTEL